MRWHKSKDIFEKECANYPGFVTKYRVSNQYCDNLDHVGYENYRHVCHKWHYKLAKAMIVCLESKDYVQIRNALIILIKIIPFFPVLYKLSQIIEKKIEKLKEEEKNKRQDLFTLAISYLGQLKQRIANGHIMQESEFHQFVEKEKVVDFIVQWYSIYRTFYLFRHQNLMIQLKLKLMLNIMEKQKVRFLIIEYY